MRSRATLYDTPRLSAVLSHYAPDDAMPAHAHDYHQVSWLLGGELHEEDGRTEREVIQTSLGIKPAGWNHANLYGREGCLILAVNIAPDLAEEAGLIGLDAWRWVPDPTGRTGSGLAARLAGLIRSGDVLPEEAVLDLLAISATPDSLAPRDCPAWLEQARSALRDCGDTLDLTAIAREAGVHRVHLSRAFASQFGLPPSLYRARCRLARAIGDILQGESLAESAYGAGFTDQAHFSRSLKAQTGLTPARLRDLLAA